MQNMQKIMLLIKNRKKEFLLLIVSLALSIIFLEMVLQFNFLFPPPINSDGWWQEKWLKDKQNYNSNKTFYPVDKFHPILGHTLLENLRDVPLQGGIVNSNSQGIRGIKEYSVKKGNKTRILSIGDSYTFGECVNDDETFSSYLENLYDNSEVINMAVHGYGNDQQLLTLKIKGIKYNPDIIILGFLNENIDRNSLSFRDYKKPKFVLKNNELFIQNVPLESPEEFKKKYHPKTLNYLKMIRDVLFAKIIEKENVKISSKIFEQIIAESNSINSTFVFVYLPRLWEVIRYDSNPHELFYSVCGDKNIICIDPTRRILNFLIHEKNPEEFFKCHYKPEIHELIAEEIYEVLINIDLTSERNKQFS